MKAQVLLPKVFNFPFTYNSKIKINIGDIVEVPFGSKKEIGVIWKNKHQEPKNIKLKEINKKTGYSIDKKLDTNVLSFPASKDMQKISGELGDIVMSLPFIQSESQNLNRGLEDHMMHLLAHGILHLIGFDHSDNKYANIMEAQEIKYLEFFKIANPYLI